ncbi:sphingosine-1-phosphate phosphatase 2 isoform X2 [Phasianus colchicus]|uniref:sphingosine-1-phosphate phosphatase 2 isoform X2 n=1 Tax=Phasianus colchicus TaxID=9054 RepID=UPI00129E75B6|nr:sphingosine-1-phosphate phosphatase 2 isoform X2 [Phasianus colchicus]
MARLLGTLRGSQPVARFQRCCGLFPAGEEGGGDPAEGVRHRVVCNGGDAGGQRRPGAAGCGAPNGVRGGRGPRGCVQKYVVKNYFYYYLFKFSAALGEEIFYITFLPFIYWNIDHSVSRRMIIIWSIVMYIGQVSKDILKWPRPLSPPVVKLEMRTDAEYGMPSTHAMAATAISFSFFITTTNQYKDVIGGALISAVLLVLLYPVWDSIDHVLLTSPFCPLLSIAVPLLLCYNYPKLDYYSPTRGDTTTILGAGAGATVGFWLNNQYVAPAYVGSNTGFPLITSTTVVLMLARFFVGLLVILLTRQLMKNVVLRVLCYCYKFPIADLDARRRLEVEVPYKFVTYSSVGFTATVIVPLLHQLLGLI